MVKDYALSLTITPLKMDFNGESYERALRSKVTTESPRPDAEIRVP